MFHQHRNHHHLSEPPPVKFRTQIPLTTSSNVKAHHDFRKSTYYTNGVWKASVPASPSR
jgi:hypothetical protein